jgi:hypothetical protein
MLAIKLNNIVDLQDARFCASFGADYVSFNLSRGHDMKLPERMAAEQIEWLSGPRPVLSFGTDVENFFTYTGKHTTPADCLFQFDIDADVPFEEIDRERLILEVGFDSPEALAAQFDRLHDIGQGVHFMELAPTLDTLEVRSAISDFIVQYDNVCLNLDGLGLAALHDMALMPPAVAVRRLVQENAQLLDYEKVEELLASTYFDKDVL